MLLRLRGSLLSSSCSARSFSPFIYRTFASSTNKNGSTFIPPPRPNDGFDPESRKDYEELTKIRTEHEESRMRIIQEHQAKQTTSNNQQQNQQDTETALSSEQHDYELAKNEAKPTVQQLLSLLEQGNRHEFRSIVSKNLPRIQYQLWVASVSNMSSAEIAEKNRQAKQRAEIDPAFKRAWAEEYLEQTEIRLRRGALEEEDDDADYDEEEDSDSALEDLTEMMSQTNGSTAPSMILSEAERMILEDTEVDVNDLELEDELDKEGEEEEEFDMEDLEGTEEDIKEARAKLRHNILVQLRREQEWIDRFNELKQLKSDAGVLSYFLHARTTEATLDNLPEKEAKELERKLDQGTEFDVDPETHEKVSRVAELEDDIKAEVKRRLEEQEPTVLAPIKRAVRSKQLRDFYKPETDAKKVLAFRDVNVLEEEDDYPSADKDDVENEDVQDEQELDDKELDDKELESELAELESELPDEIFRDVQDEFEIREKLERVRKENEKAKQSQSARQQRQAARKQTLSPEERDEVRDEEVPLGLVEDSDDHQPTPILFQNDFFSMSPQQIEEHLERYYLPTFRTSQFLDRVEKQVEGKSPSNPYLEDSATEYSSDELPPFQPEFADSVFSKAKKIPPPPKIYPKKVDALGRAFAIGARKTARAQVWLKSGTGEIIINNMNQTNKANNALRTHQQYFPMISQRAQLLLPFEVTDTMGQFDVFVRVGGGGLSGQAEAARLAIARALVRYDPVYRTALKKTWLLYRDPRQVERKKTGLKKARKAFQWVKR